MFRYVITRLWGAIPTLFVIIVVCFFMMRIAPGGPFDVERRLPPEIEKNVLANYELDKPVLRQFLDINPYVCQQRIAANFGGSPQPEDLAREGLAFEKGRFLEIEKNRRPVLCFGGYFGKLVQGDFGPSYKKKDASVAELIGEGAPVSATIGIAAIMLATLIGISAGLFAALRQNRLSDYSLMTVAMVGITIPSFVMAPILTLYFGVYLGWLPTATIGDGSLRFWILPVIALALPQIAVISRLTRGSMIEVMRSNFVRTARAKGLPERLVVGRHALRAGLLPIVSYLGPATAALVTGSLVIEQIFGLPGIGKHFINGAITRDYPLVMGVIILYAALVIALNLFADVIYGLLDPKVRYD